MRITDISINTKYISGLDRKNWPVTCTITTSGTDKEKDWQRVETTLSEAQTRQVCEMIAKMLVVNPQLDMCFKQLTDVEIATLVAERKREEEAAKEATLAEIDQLDFVPTTDEVA